MEEVAPLIWPPERRIGFCYKNQWSNLPVGSALTQSDVDELSLNHIYSVVTLLRTLLSTFKTFLFQNECVMKQGSPFQPFWDHLKIDFADTTFYNISYNPGDFELWSLYYPPRDYLVLAFKGAPASYPVSEVSSCFSAACCCLVNEF